MVDCEHLEIMVAGISKTKVRFEGGKQALLGIIKKQILYKQNHIPELHQQLPTRPKA